MANSPQLNVKSVMITRNSSNSNNMAKREIGKVFEERKVRTIWDDNEEK